jgi:hypothetical protein
VPQIRAPWSKLVDYALYAQPLATLGSSRVQNLLSAAGSHPGPEAMSTLTFKIARLKGSFHDLVRLTISMSPRRVEPAGTIGVRGERGRDFMEGVGTCQHDRC